jgi:hypothetical protein
MKNYVEKEFNEKRLAANKEYAADYEARRRAATEELKSVLRIAREAADEVLAKYGMDTIASKRKQGEYYPHELIRFYEGEVCNSKEWQEIRDHEQKLYRYQSERLERFYLECDLGCDKEQFFEMVAALNFDDM